MESAILKAENFNAFFGKNHILKNINFEVEKNTVWAIMGPSGCGKTTFIRCVNRMHELAPGATVEGSLKL
jgi:phosphate transport system ATP-binding protein